MTCQGHGCDLSRPGAADSGGQIPAYLWLGLSGRSTGSFSHHPKFVKTHWKMPVLGQHPVSSSIWPHCFWGCLGVDFRGPKLPMAIAPASPLNAAGCAATVRRRSGATALWRRISGSGPSPLPRPTAPGSPRQILERKTQEDIKITQVDAQITWGFACTSPHHT